HRTMRNLGPVETGQRGRLEQEVVWGSQVLPEGRKLTKPLQGANALSCSEQTGDEQLGQDPGPLRHLGTHLPVGTIKEVQKRIVNFFWAGQHWTRAPVLYLPLQEGGQGLIDLSCRFRTFRLQAAQRLLYEKRLHGLARRTPYYGVWKI
ncbi:hypothetical protein QTP86_029585, partial [Hemibagrus guttatus]